MLPQSKLRIKKRSGRLSGPVQQGGTYHNPDMRGNSCLTYMGVMVSPAKSTDPKKFQMHLLQGELTHELLGNQTISARFRNQKTSIAWIRLDFLTQSVNVCFQRVGGYARVVAPDFVQQNITCHDTICAAVEEL